MSLQAYIIHTHIYTHTHTRAHTSCTYIYILKNKQYFYIEKCKRQLLHMADPEEVCEDVPNMVK